MSVHLPRLGPALAAGAALLALAGVAGAIGDATEFVGRGVTRTGEVINVSAIGDPNARSTARWSLPDTRAPIRIQLSCVSIQFDGVAVLYASGRSPDLPGYFLLRAVDSQAGGRGDSFGVASTETPPAGYTDPGIKCAAAEVATSPLMGGDFRAIGDPSI